ncbi:hypothetical protein J2I47_04465 [Fibrella sp. HMF5335]|uniref:LVIVD repeat-containing protein n=1 Tax=Fibrella rubiginis TaxID=2817060 RepID=A0A939GE25_9BACT|nr:hypothetical protein [Fibrella rubiginis]MBO0935795.1 hypothetical protein [Fibrella rubiginis]
MKPILYFLLPALLCACSAASDTATPTTGAGTGGSTARFTVADNFLYVLQKQSLLSYDVSTSQNPVAGGNVALYGNSPETIFPFGKYLLLGTPTGILFYDRSLKPATPTYVSTYHHWFSCDPVVAQGTIAYATLRSGTPCRTGQNALETVDISDPTKPKLIRSYPMTNPRGLGIDDKTLFVGEGESGLRVFDATDPASLREIAFFKNISTYDLIPARNVLIVTGTGGIYQYDYSDPTAIRLLSTLPVTPK